MEFINCQRGGENMKLFLTNVCFITFEQQNNLFAVKKNSVFILIDLVKLTSDSLDFNKSMCIDNASSFAWRSSARRRSHSNSFSYCELCLILTFTEFNSPWKKTSKKKKITEAQNRPQLNFYHIDSILNWILVSVLQRQELVIPRIRESNKRKMICSERFGNLRMKISR